MMIYRRIRQHRDVADDQFFDRRGTAASKTSSNTTTRRRLKEIFSILSLFLSPRGAVDWFIPYYTPARKPQVAIFTGYHRAVFILAVLEWDGMGRYSKPILLRLARKHTALFSDKVHTGLLQNSFMGHIINSFYVLVQKTEAKGILDLVDAKRTMMLPLANALVAG